MFGYLQATAVRPGSKFKDFGGKLGYPEVTSARSWGQVRGFCGHVEAKLGILGHVPSA